MDTVNFTHAFTLVILVLCIMLTEVSFVIGKEEDGRGHWGPWGEWGECSATCGSGTRQAKRVYIEGPKDRPRKEPYYALNTIACTNRDFPECPRDGYWSGWGRWSECTKACGGGERTRKRDCYGKTEGGQDCDGENFDKEKCSKEPCPRLPSNFDLSKCTTKSNFTCVSGKMCIDIALKCDEKVQCHDGSDEVGCARGLRTGSVRYDLRGGVMSALKTTVWPQLAALGLMACYFLTRFRWHQ